MDPFTLPVDDSGAVLQTGDALITMQAPCRGGNDYDGDNLELRLVSILVILVCSTAGALFPIFAKQNANHHIVKRLLPGWSFFAAKFFGSGVIVATAFIHLLSPAEDALRDPCLAGGLLSEYDWVSGIMLITTFVLFCVELVIMRYSDSIAGAGVGANASLSLPSTAPLLGNGRIAGSSSGPDKTAVVGNGAIVFGQRENGDAAADDEDEDDNLTEDSYLEHHPDHHINHNHHHHRGRRSGRHSHNPSTRSALDLPDPNPQLAALFILEFGVIFHSVFIGLTLAVSGDEFVTLFIVMIFHQTFEGLGLGARLADTPWPQSRRRWTPYALGLAFGLTTPIAIALGLLFRHSYPPESKTTLIVNGIFDSISAGILNYTGLVELMAREIMFSPEMRSAPLSTLLSALAFMILGAGLMALLGKWA